MEQWSVTARRLSWWVQNSNQQEGITTTQTEKFSLSRRDY